MSCTANEAVPLLPMVAVEGGGSPATSPAVVIVSTVLDVTIIISSSMADCNTSVVGGPVERPAWSADVLRLDARIAWHFAHHLPPPQSAAVYACG